VIAVALRGHEREGAGPVGGDPFGGFLDGFHAFDAQEADGEVAGGCEDVGAVSGPGLIVVFPVNGVADVVVLVFDAEWFLVFRFVRASVIFPGGLLVIIRASSLLTRWPDISKTSRMTSATCDASGKSIPLASAAQHDHCLIWPRERSRMMSAGGFRVSGAIFAKTDSRSQGRLPLTFMR
jgi:hypothetical protein